MKLFSTLMKFRENLLIRDPVIFKRLTKALESDKRASTYYTVEVVGKMQVFVSCPITVFLNRYVFVWFRFPISYSNYGFSANAFAILGKHGNYRFIPFTLTKQDDNVCDLLAYKPRIVHGYMNNAEKRNKLLKIFDFKGVAY